MLIGDKECNIKILSYLPEHDLVKLSLVNKYFYELSRDDNLWRNKLAEKFGKISVNLKDETLSCFEFYKILSKKHSKTQPECAKNYFSWISYKETPVEGLKDAIICQKLCLVEEYLRNGVCLEEEVIIMINLDYYKSLAELLVKYVFKTSPKNNEEIIMVLLKFKIVPSSFVGILKYLTPKFFEWALKNKLEVIDKIHCYSDCSTDVIKWLICNKILTKYDGKVRNIFTGYHSDLMKISLDNEIFPPISLADEIVKRILKEDSQKDIDKLDLLAKYNVYPSNFMVNIAHFETHKILSDWFKSNKIYPDDNLWVTKVITTDNLKDYEEYCENGEQTISWVSNDCGENKIIEVFKSSIYEDDDGW